MTATRFRRDHPQLTFIALALIVNVVASRIGPRSPSHAVQAAAVFDMTLTVTALYYWLVVRPGLRPKISLLFVLSLGLLRASLAFSSLWMGALAEIGIATSVACGFRSIPFLTSELSVLYYALAWWAKPDVPSGTTAFYIERREGFNDLMLMVAMASLLEAAPMHLMVAHWSVKAAWILTALSVYGAVWAIGVYRSFAMLPTLTGNGEIVIRFGLLYRLRVPIDCIATRTHGAIAFTHPLTAERIFGLKKTVTCVEFHAGAQASAFYDAIG